MRDQRAKIVNRAVREEEAEAELFDLHREKRQLDLQAARLLAKIDGSCHFVYRSCSSIGHYGELNGYSDQEARILSAVGKSLRFKPELEEEMLSGRLSLAGAAALSKVYENPELVRDGDDWLLWAEQWATRDLEREIRKRMRELESGEATSVMTAILTCTGRQKFERARELACRKKRKLLSEGETVEVLSDHYLDSFAPERKKPRKRRMPETGTPGKGGTPCKDGTPKGTGTSGSSGHRSRTVPAEVKRQVRARWGDRCAVPRCRNRNWLSFAHALPYALLGSQEANNLHLLCNFHHRLYDLGLMTIEGTPDSPVFRTKDGGSIGKPP